MCFTANVWQNAACAQGQSDRHARTPKLRGPPALSSVAAMTKDQPLLGILLMLGFCVLAPFGDALAKLLGERVPLGLAVFVRFAVQAVILVPVVWAGGRVWRMRGRVLGIVVARTVLHVVGIGLMFTALQYLPLADAVAILFVMPFLMLGLGYFLLHEEVGPRRLWAAAAGFVGTLLVVQPSFAAVGWPALLPLGVAVNFAFFMLLTRQIAKETDPVGMQMVSGWIAVALLAPLMIWGAAQGVPVFAVPVVSAENWGLLLTIGLVGSVSHLLMVWSLRYAPAATLAPMQYLEIPVAVAIGWAIWRDLPNGLAVLGIAVTIAAGLYIILQERATVRAARQKLVQPANGLVPPTAPP